MAKGSADHVGAKPESNTAPAAPSFLIQAESALTRWLLGGLLVLVASALLAAGIFVERANNALALDRSRVLVLNELSLLRARLEGHLSANLKTAQGLVATIQVEPTLDQNRFAEFAKPLFEGTTQLRNIAAAPEMVIRMIYPLAGNEKAIGLNYVSNEAQREAAERARLTGELVVAGPVDLVQGGKGFIGRIPVFVSREGEERQFWGIVSAVIDADRLYQASGLLNPELGIEVALRGKDGLGAAGEPFFGNTALFGADPVVTDVSLPLGTWQLVGVPKGGWKRHADNLWTLRLLMLAVGLMILLPTAGTIGLLRKNQEQNIRLQGLFELSPIGIALNDFATGKFVDGNDALIRPTGYTREQFLNLSFWDLTPPQYEVQEALLQERLRTTGRYGPYEKEYIRQDGSRYPVLLNGMLIRDRGGRELIWSIVEDISARKQSELQLAESRQQLELVIDSTAVGIWDWDIPSGATRFNPRWAEIVGYTLEELEPVSIDTWIRLTHPVDLAHSRAQLEAHWRGEKPRYICRARMRHKSGHWIWVLDTGKVVEWLPDGKPCRMVGTHLDITEQVDAEQQLARQQEMLEQMSLQARIGAWEYEVQDNTLFWTDMTRLIHEVDPDLQPDFETALEFYKNTEDRACIRNALQQCLERGTPFQLELMLTTARGAELWVMVSGQAERVDGRTVRLFGAFQDVDARKRTQMQLEQSARHNQVLAELTVHPAILSGDLAIAKAPLVQKMCEALQVQRCSIWLFSDALQTLSCTALYDASAGQVECDLVLTQQDFPAYFAALRTEAHVAVTDARTDSRTREFADSYLVPLHIHSLLDAVIFAGDDIVGVICAEQQHSFRQWSEADENFVISLATLIGSICASERRRAVEQELIRARDAAEAAARAKSEFLATMSHEIRTPMNGVLGMLNLLQKPGLEPGQQRKVSIALASAESLLTLLNDILDFSKVEAGKLELELLDFDLRAMLGEFAESMALRAQEKNIELILDLTGIEQSLVKGDPGRLRQIFTNLVGNAIKFTERGEIIIRARLRPEQDHLLLEAEVTDTGIGIREDKIEQLFEPFTQGDASTTRQYGGTGLGLAIVRKICNMMQGSISATSAPGKGSTFSFRVNLQRSQRARLVVPSVDAKQLQILIVDDNQTNREVLHLQLEMWGARVVEAASGEAALAVCEAKLQAFPECLGKPFDIALLDMQMPHMDGAELGRRLKQDQRFNAMPLVMMTSMGHRGEAKFFADLGFSAYFPKPVTTEDLYTALNVVADGGDVLQAANPLVTRHFVKTLLPSTPAVLPQWPANTRLLLVEDNPVNQEVARLMLADLGLAVDVANDGNEALQTLSSTVPEDAYTLVLMDCQMPELDGFEATRRIRAGDGGDHHRQVPVIAMTANVMKGDRERCLAAGMNGYLGKPVEAAALLQKLSKWLLGTDTASRPSLEQKDDADSKPDLLHWDQEGALLMVKGKRDRLQALVRLFCEVVPERLAKLDTALAQQDLAQIEYLAHSLKGSVGQLKAPGLYQLASELELVAKQGDIALALQLGQQLAEAMPQWIARLQQFLALDAAS